MSDKYHIITTNERSLGGAEALLRLSSTLSDFVLPAQKKSYINCDPSVLLPWQQGSKYIDSNSTPMYNSQSIILLLLFLFVIMIKCGVHNKQLDQYKFCKSKWCQQQIHTYLQLLSFLL